MNTPSSNERRDTERLPLRAYAELAHNLQRYEAHVLDISEQGARIALLVDHNITTDHEFTLVLEPQDLPDILSKYLPLTLTAKAVHIRQHILGIRCSPLHDQDAKRFAKLLAQI
ncbi:PilZ domain-containing protein [Gilvimarinus sp. SDUM040013]|uniref:PilZ domain-containing protein n=1 Tax=Gilvimarinus gilvus TaxID=3058038 RepID=A0ABU4RV30_9GAMM|nr:PilZ domain-containing protein [Gilvimarinus sp. SDUM040013]MDO3387904.1 PilZ domain-containing protein [Gilvimarinus sp. SDUM040013]MDX6848725.1 PilZ domain-containing protein [Gilvimarinus sp. SDUM040013]